MSLFLQLDEFPNQSLQDSGLELILGMESQNKNLVFLYICLKIDILKQFQ
jgi:hypothetical protein